MKYPDTPRRMLGKCQYFLGSLDTISIIRCPYEVPRYSKDNARKMPVFPGKSRHYKQY